MRESAYYMPVAIRHEAGTTINVDKLVHTRASRVSCWSDHDGAFREGQEDVIIRPGTAWTSGTHAATVGGGAATGGSSAADDIRPRVLQ